MNNSVVGLEVESTFGSSHEPHTGLLDVGKVIVCMAGEVVCLCIQRVVVVLPLHFEVERSEGSVGLSLVCPGILEFAFSVFESEVPLCRDVLADAMAQGADQLVAQASQS